MDQFNKILNQYKLPLILTFVGLVLIIGGIFSSGLLNKPKVYPQASIIKDDANGQIKVDLSGAIKNPAVYSLDSSSRLEDAIKVAGGFSEDANVEYISKSLNLSAKLSDGQKIYIPFNGEPFGYAQGGSIAGVNIEGKIGINSATQSKLEELPGVGPATAQKIISGRPYSSIGDLYSRKVVSKAVYEKIKELVDTN